LRVVGCRAAFSGLETETDPATVTPPPTLPPTPDPPAAPPAPIAAPPAPPDTIAAPALAAAATPAATPASCSNHVVSDERNDDDAYSVQEARQDKRIELFVRVPIQQANHSIAQNSADVPMPIATISVQNIAYRAGTSPLGQAPAIFLGDIRDDPLGPRAMSSGPCNTTPAQKTKHR